ncbi:MAG TPA: hypothetical protein VN948_23360 [Terriglobales bacterium]|nr:hypothetical protein [Terriglobales bacterium]
MKLLPTFAIALTSVVLGSGQVSAQKWQRLQNQPTFRAGAMLLLTDGTVLVHEEPQNGQNWYKLTPDIQGRYVNGTWTKVASLPKGYSPLFFGSAVLPDGRVVIEGGEFNNGKEVWATLGAVYDPVKDQWKSIQPPGGWNYIGDATATVLPDGTLMQVDCCDLPPMAALLDAKTLTWTPTGANKFDGYKKEGLTLLPNGNVLDVDTYVLKYQRGGKNSEIYDPSAGAWSSAGSTVAQLWDSAANCGGKSKANHEIGAAVLRPDGTVFATGANSCAAGHTAIYDSNARTWTAGPDFPNGLNIADGPAALETNGKVVMMASPGFQKRPATFFEWDGSSLTQVSGPPRAPKESSFPGHLLELPSGQLLFTDFSSDVEVFTPRGTYNKAWKPTVTSSPRMVTRGKSYVIHGTQFNGLSQGAMYNDDFQDATNYPLVRIVNLATKHVFYCRTHDHSTMAVATGSEPVSTHFDVPTSMETGGSSLYVVANGIPSAPVAVTVR